MSHSYWYGEWQWYGSDWYHAGKGCALGFFMLFAYTIFAITKHPKQECQELIYEPMIQSRGILGQDSVGTINMGNVPQPRGGIGNSYQ